MMLERGGKAVIQPVADIEYLIRIVILSMDLDILSCDSNSSYDLCIFSQQLTFAIQQLFDP